MICRRGGLVIIDAYHESTTLPWTYQGRTVVIHFNPGVCAQLLTRVATSFPYSIDAS